MARRGVVSHDDDVGRVLCGRELGLALTACLAFSLGLAASSSFGATGVIFSLSSAERSAEIAAELPNSYTSAAPADAEPADDDAETGGEAVPTQTIARSFSARSTIAIPASNAAAPAAAAGGPNGKCFVLVDRHNHKTGGTTIREIMMQNARFGDCHYWGYGQDEPHWSKWLAAAHEVLPQLGRTSNAPPTKLCLEAHFPVFGFMETRVKSIAKLRAAARAPPGSNYPGCTVLLTTRVREPLSFYLSYFKWDIAGRQAKDGAAVYGRSFLEWSPTDLQSNALWNAYSTEFASRFYDNRYPNRFRQSLRMSNRTFSKLVDALDLFDVVGTVEDFDASLLLTNDLLGGGQLGGGLGRLQYKRTQPVHRHRKANLPPITNEEVCPDMAACAAHVRRIAPLDHVLYARYASAFKARIAALGEPFAERLRAFKAAGARPWVGGADPESVANATCSWQADSVPESYEYADNPCMTVPPKLGWLADRCMGVTNKNAEVCCVRFKPTPKGMEQPPPKAGSRDGEWHTIWTRQVCRMRGGRCTAASSRIAPNEPAWTRGTIRVPEEVPPAVRTAANYAGRRRLADGVPGSPAEESRPVSELDWAQTAVLDDDDYVELLDE